MGILDRYIFRSLVVNYVIALAGMMGLYIVLDLFFNMDEFTEKGEPFGHVIANVVSYYGCHLFLYFGQLSGVITTFACLATIARLRKQNELTAALASGISLYRLAAPVIGFGLFTTALWVINAELAIPNIAPELSRRRDDPRGERTYGVWFLPDGKDALLSAQQFFPGGGTLRRLMILNRDPSGTVQSTIEAELAMWERLDGHPQGGRWVLTGGRKNVRESSQRPQIGPSEQPLGEPVKYYEGELDPEKIKMRQSAQWIKYLSSGQLAELAGRGLANPVAASVHQTRNQRFATPIVNLVLLLLGLPFMLNRDPATILSDATKCLVVCGGCFVVTFIAGGLMGSDSYSALPAWLPILIFTPVAVILMDRIRT